MFKLGLQAKLLYGVAGASATSEAKNVKDLTLSLETGTADITTRGTSGWRAKMATLKEGSLEFQTNYDTSETFCSTLITNFLGNSAMAFFVTDGAGTGLLADWALTNCTIEQPLEEAVSLSVTAEPTDIGGASGRAPAWVSASGGSAA